MTPNKTTHKAHLFFLLFLMLALVFSLSACFGRDDTTEATTTKAPVTTAKPTVTAPTTTVKKPPITTEAPVTTEDPFKNGTPGLIYESTGNGFATVKGIVDKSATAVVIPKYTPNGDRVIIIDKQAFAGNTAMQSVMIPDTVYKIDNSAFFGCTSLTSVFLSEGIEELGVGVFEKCTALESITLPKSIQTLQSKLFAGCYALKHLTIAEGNPYFVAEGNCILKKGEPTLLFGCAGSKVPKTVTAIEAFAFFDSGLTSLIIPDSVKSIGTQAFALNRSLTSIVLSESLETIGDLAFNGCEVLKHLYLPASLKTLGMTPFRACLGIETLSVAKDNAVYDAEGLCLMEKATDTLIQGFFRSTIPSGVKAIGKNAFAAAMIETAVIPEGCTVIADGAFAQCHGLRNLTLPKSLTEIASNAFVGTSVLSKVSYGGSEHAFEVLTADVTFASEPTFVFAETDE